MTALSNKPCYGSARERESVITSPSKIARCFNSRPPAPPPPAEAIQAQPKIHLHFTLPAPVRNQYLQSRDKSGTLTKLAQRDSSLLDCLSFPITAAHWVRRLRLPRYGLMRCREKGFIMSPLIVLLLIWPGDYGCCRYGRQMNIVVWGATQKAEVGPCA